MVSATSTYIFELRAECAAQKVSTPEETTGRRSFVPTTAKEVSSLKAHVVGTLLPAVEAIGGVGIYTSGRSDLLAEEAEMALHAARVARSIGGVSSTTGTRSTSVEDVRRLLELSLDTSENVLGFSVSPRMIVPVFVCMDGTIHHVAVYTSPVPVPPTFAPPGREHVACIVGPPRDRPEIKDISWIRGRKDLEERGARAMRVMPGTLNATCCDVLLCTKDGDLLEGLVTNLFVIVTNNEYRGSNGSKEECEYNEYKVQTAPAGTVLEGTARRKVIDACRRLGIPVDFTAPAISERHTWRGAFLTNAVRQCQALDRISCVETNVWGFEPWEISFERDRLPGDPRTITGMIANSIS